MPTARPCDLPPDALLNRYTGTQAYVDCYAACLRGRVSHAQYVEAFYTTFVFKLERWLLRWLVSRPSTDVEARQLAQGHLDAFAAWTVEARAPDQLLLSDFRGRTRSWLMVAGAVQGETAVTRLYFGSAVVPARGASADRKGMGQPFQLLLGFHKLYSRILLGAAHSRLARESI
jgi:hypothetical protein